MSCFLKKQTEKVFVLFKNVCVQEEPVLWILSASPVFLPHSAGGSREVWLIYFPEEHGETHLTLILHLISVQMIPLSPLIAASLPWSF